MTTRTSIYPLRLPVSIKTEAEKLAAVEGTSLNQFLSTAVAEKVAVLRTAATSPSGVTVPTGPRLIA